MGNCSKADDVVTFLAHVSIMFLDFSTEMYVFNIVLLQKNTTFWTFHGFHHLPPSLKSRFYDLWKNARAKAFEVPKK